MKILFIGSELNKYGGIQKYNRHLLKALEDLGHDVVSVEFKRLDLISKVFYSLKFLFKSLFFAPDFTICANINYSSLCYAAKKIFNRDYSVTLYGIQALDIKPLYRVFLESAKFINAPFEWTLHNAIKQMPSMKDKTTILPNPIIDEEFSIKNKPEYLLGRHKLGGAKIIYTISRLSSSERDNKGYCRVIEAMPLVLEKIPNAKYVLAGGGDDKPYVEDLISKKNLKNSVILAGPIEDKEMADYYNLADVFVFPSKVEGFPALVLLESLACGVPVIGGDQAGSDEYPWNGEVGLIVKADSVNDIALAIIKILNGDAPTKILDRNRLRKIILEINGREGYKKYLNNFIKFMSAE